MELREYINIVWRHRWWVLSMALLSAFACVGLYAKQKEIYRVSARVRIMPQNEAQRVLAGDIPINTVLPYATTLALLESPDWQNAIRDRHKDIEEFPRRYLVTHSVDFASSIVTIAVTGEAPEVSRQVLASAVETYRQIIHDKASEETQNNITLINDLVSKAGQTINDREQRLRKKQAETGVYNYDSTLQRLNQEILGLQQQISQGEAKLSEARAELRSKEERLADPNVPGMLEEPLHVREQRDKIGGLERQLENMLARYTEKTPALIQHQAELKTEREYLEKLVAEAAENHRQRHLRDLEQVARESRDAVGAVEEAQARLHEILTARQADLSGLIKNHSELGAEERALETDLARLKSYNDVLSNLNIQTTYERKYVDVLTDPLQAVIRGTGSVAGRHYFLTILIGLLVGLGAAYIAEIFDSRIKSEYDVKRYLNLPLLAEIPKVRKLQPKIITEPGIPETVSEIFNGLALMLENTYLKRHEKIFMITSATEREGKSTISANLSIAFARNNKKTLLIDGDLHIGDQYKLMKVEQMGLSNILTQALEQKGTPNVASFLQQHPEIPNLVVLAAGQPIKNPTVMLKSDYFRKMVEELAAQFDVVVIDSPPITLTADGIVLGGLSDYVVLVNSAMESSRGAAKRCMNILMNAEVDVAGVLLNKMYVHQLLQYRYYNYRYRYRNR